MGAVRCGRCEIPLAAWFTPHPCVPVLTDDVARKEGAVDAELTAARARHHPWTHRERTHPVCAGCHADYPCDVVQVLAAYDAAVVQAAHLVALDELADAAKSWATRDYMIDPSKGGLERVKRTDRLVRAARALIEADGGVWYEVSDVVRATPPGETRSADDLT